MLHRAANLALLPQLPIRKIRVASAILPDCVSLCLSGNSKRLDLPFSAITIHLQ